MLMQISTDNRRINIIVITSLMLVFMIVGTTWILHVPNTQISDFGNFWDRVPGFFVGDKLYQTDNDYFSKYAYQTGFMVYILSVVKLFGYKIFVIQFLNVIYQALILLFTYLLVIKIFDNIKLARLSVLLLMVDLDWFALNSQASNQYLGSLLYLITFYLLMQDKSRYYILAGITLAAGCLIRPIGPVIIAGIVVFTICYLLLKNKDYHRIGKIMISLAVYFILFSLAGWGIKATGINNYGLSNNDPEWKFVTGLNYQSNGTYSSDMDKLIDANKSRAQMNPVEQTKLHSEIDFLNQHHAWFKLFVNKTQVLWSTRTMATDFTSFGLNHSAKTVDLINYLAYAGSIMLIIFSWIGSLALFKAKFSNNLYLLLLPLLAFAVVQLVIEVQGRYRIEFLPILSIVGSLGLYNTINSFSYLKIGQKNTLRFN
ncbi:ArnT family glycosyltransferase [Companilactobacillus kimchiensis]|uniref:Glycosyltransferase RgtA/B/C/D-like domain-containing protein n=1 Tax=Companilactobacillus kimchiensis TaxID=993692 RepID=A0A0R2LBY1_9LACO|nr:glycosyltransferase family 39 protein [Companilactobacillus kimchiensis]KRN99072.1 hypothetical protein IV57_GL000496 [Companilactobacillus kimchiensis]